MQIHPSHEKRYKLQFVQGRAGKQVMASNCIFFTETLHDDTTLAVTKAPSAAIQQHSSANTCLETILVIGVHQQTLTNQFNLKTLFCCWRFLFTGFHIPTSSLIWLVNKEKILWPILTRLLNSVHAATKHFESLFSWGNYFMIQPAESYNLPGQQHFYDLSYSDGALPLLSYLAWSLS